MNAGRTSQPSAASSWIDLGAVPVAVDAVRGHVLVDRYEVRRVGRGAAGAGHTALGVDDRVADQLLAGERARARGSRPSSSSRGSRPGLARAIASRWSSVSPKTGLGLQRGCAMRPVPALAERAVVQAEVRREVDDPHPPLAELGHDDGRRAVRDSETNATSACSASRSASNGSSSSGTRWRG